MVPEGNMYNPCIWFLVWVGVAYLLYQLSDLMTGGGRSLEKVERMNCRRSSR